MPWNAFGCTGTLMKPIILRDAQPGRAVSRGLKT
jgi:hypothetical protein